ncbi:amidohydrolase [Pseudomonas sp. M30-35]|uniref:amidohydrolase family protein n=1 Tax=Pseudomonas sp. M30-35 TaxID=1981174 RepID=UPI000B3C85DC|nr:amidohydrolase family protein [Pseudomonas sp. M30-35]ARU87777.1 amidohydrolase [Pseudomonas sp. M30-35]
MTPSQLPRITGIDTHAHIFNRELPLASGRRYNPDYDALVEQYLSLLDSCCLSHGVLVQPSFLGTDNSFMLAALNKYPERLRGVAVVLPSIGADELDHLAASGVTGVRLNLVGQALEDYSADLWQVFFQRVAVRQWSVEIQRSIDDLAQILPAILSTGVNVVIDHFGLPPGGINPGHASHKAFLELLANQRLWLKLSAPYRSQLTAKQAASTFEVLRSASGGVDRMLWGSDWPHTQFENSTNYTEQFQGVQALLPDPQDWQKVLLENPARLFKFANNI